MMGYHDPTPRQAADHHRRETWRLRCLKLRTELQCRGVIGIPALNDMTEDFVLKYELKFAREAKAAGAVVFEENRK